MANGSIFVIFDTSMYKRNCSYSFFFLALFIITSNIIDAAPELKFNFFDYEAIKPLTLLSFVPLIKPKRLKNKEKEAFILPSNLKEILVGLLLGDIHGRLRRPNENVSFIFKQGINHQDYIHHLYNLFNKYCPSEPKKEKSLLDSRTGKIYESIKFSTYALPCFK
jgi:hypothetical protein